MLSSSLIPLAVLTACALASPLNNVYVVHEKRDALPIGWEKTSRLDPDSFLPLKIGLSQSNLDKGAEWLAEVSHPGSELYGQHWTAKEIAEAFAPSDETVDSVREWLKAEGIDGSRIKQAQSLGFLQFHATVAEAERLLKTKYHKYSHLTTGQPHVACEEYSVPAHLKEHIDFVYPSVSFDKKIVPRDSDSNEDVEDPIDVKKPGRPGKWNPPGFGRWMKPWNIIRQLDQCDTQIVPNCLRALYEFPVNSNPNPKNSYGIVEYTPQAYVPSDLDLFFKNFSRQQVGDRPILDSIDGGVVQQQVMNFSYNGESDLDLEYAMTLVYPQKVTLYQTGDLVEGGSFNNFLDAIDGSYCTYDGGDDTSFDATYPDPYPGGYNGPENCGGYAATKVISTSYSFNEHDASPAYEKRQCHEYMKLGMMGVSVLYSSGDNGVAGNGGSCIAGPGETAPYNDGGSGRFNPGFPSTCPYITSVGATQVIPGTNIVQALATNTQPEEACETVIYSGGGFSNVFPLPSYQASAVHEWFANNPPPYGADRFNNSQRTRGFPDISANGANYVVTVDGQFAIVYGTSASSPTLGSILTLINQQRYNHGKSSIGFVNPVAYAHPEVFNDITQGGNQGCGTPGFESAQGWDPVTGLGTPNYPKMLDLWLSLR